MTGSTIARLRHERNLSQHQLAVKAGLTARTISRLENDKHPPRLETLQALAEAFGMTPDRLLAEARKDAEKAAAAAGAPS